MNNITIFKIPTLTRFISAVLLISIIGRKNKNTVCIYFSENKLFKHFSMLGSNWKLFIITIIIIIIVSADAYYFFLSFFFSHPISFLFVGLATLSGCGEYSSGVKTRIKICQNIRKKKNEKNRIAQGYPRLTHPLTIWIIIIIFFYCAAEYQSRSILLRQLLNRQSVFVFYIRYIK